jgi:hypothetical protein
MSNIVYITAGTVTNLEFDAADMFEAMLEAQDREGSITWTALRAQIALGTFYDADLGDTVRLAVFDLDTANGLDVIHVTNWVNGHSDVQPELS